ncbi:hypothetical protein [Rhizobium binxianense]
MASVSVTNVRKSYGHFEVLHGVNIGKLHLFDAQSGERLSGEYGQP